MVPPIRPVELYFRLEKCPKCKERFYDLRKGRCLACGYKGWGFFRPEEKTASKQKIPRLRKIKLWLLNIE